jgi:hypothetical protein
MLFWKKENLFLRGNNFEKVLFRLALLKGLIQCHNKKATLIKSSF